MSKNKKAFGSKRAVPKNKKTGKSKITLDKLFKNNKFLLVFSFLMACIPVSYTHLTLPTIA